QFPAGTGYSLILVHICSQPLLGLFPAGTGYRIHSNSHLFPAGTGYRTMEYPAGAGYRACELESLSTQQGLGTIIQN
ncbi:MAG: hypothetical protein RXR03_08465, partial [Thermocladium sp.]